MEHMADRNKRRITIPKETWDCLLSHADAERLKVSEVVRNSITPESIAINVITEYLTKTGYYPLKKEGVADVP